MNIPSLEGYLVLFLAIALLTIAITRRIAVPYTLGLVIIGLGLSVFGLLPNVHLTPPLVLFVFLPALLFEGAWSIRWHLVRAHWRTIFFLAGPGLLLSLGVIASILHILDGLDWGTAFLLAAILSPTDPVAVLSLFRQLHVDERLSTIIEGESLFNDGVAGSLYQTFLAVVLLTMQGHSSGGLQAWGEGVLTFLIEAGGAVALGLLVGWLMSRIVKRIDEPLMEVTLTIITAYGVYLVADQLHLSAIMAVIVAALVLGNYGRRVGLSENSRVAVDQFWSVLAFIANALIFLLVGVQLNPLALPLVPGEEMTTLLVAVFAVSVVLVARLALVLVVAARSMLTLSPRVRAMGPKQHVPRSWQLVIFWSGLRGALSLALVLALPTEIPHRSILVVSTYAVVFFTLLIQGITLRWLLKHIPSLQTPLPSAEASEEQVAETSV
ncbi:cation:proton antiporter [Ktedonospora formicarum]|uniref:Sodium/hydrogen exchanger n=1 Tax=Ktedonospora formicarum TaxID=2778364 RepID=A0A8J3MU12_9CHLR|nr:cation:proton antiporter [Ktedonospora formicarum]GHO48777.1 sodium/hydrogen exchanger [Ktedonospora formicarum]